MFKPSHSSGNAEEGPSLELGGTSLESRLSQWAEAGLCGRAEDGVVGLCAGHASGTPLALGPAFQKNW